MFLVTFHDIVRSMPVLAQVLLLILLLIFFLIVFVYYRRGQVYKRLSASGLPTIFWRPRFISYNPSDFQDATAKLPSSSITNILPRMQRLNGPYGMYGTVYGWDTAVIHVAHPVPARAVLRADTNTKSPPALIQNSSGATKAPAYNHFKNFCGEGVFTADGDDWKAKRSAVMHALLRVEGGYEAAVEKEAQRAIHRLQEDLDQLAEKPVDIVPLLQRATIGIIFRYITHSDLDDTRSMNNQHHSTSVAVAQGMLTSYLQSITRIRMIILAQSRSIWFLLPRWTYRLFSSLYQEEEKTMDPIRAFSARACNEARPGSPLAKLGIRPEYEAPSGKVSKNLLDEAITLLFAGQDTSAATLSWTLHLLSLYPAVQAKLALEIHSIIGELDIKDGMSKKQIFNMPYLDAVIKESMRLYPVAPFVVRQLPTDVMLQDEYNVPLNLPAHSFVCIWIYGLHRHPKFWKDPDEFQPERWLENDSVSKDDGIRNGAYMPFALGPRNCVGQPLAHIILRKLLSHLVYRYEFRDDRLNDNDNPKAFLKNMQAGFTVLPQDGVHLTLRQRHFKE